MTTSSADDGTSALPLRALVGAVVAQVRVDLAQVQLVLGDGRSGRLALAGPVVVEGPDGPREGPATSPGVVAALVPLLGEVLTVVVTRSSGRLELAAGPHRVRVEADAQESAWDASLADGTLVVCRPGGQVDVVRL